MDLQTAIAQEAVYLHNAAETVYLDSLEGFYLQRFPTILLKDLGHSLSLNTTDTYYHSTGCEIRWHTKSAEISKITIATPDTMCNILVLLNNKQHSAWQTANGCPVTIELKVPEQYKAHLQAKEQAPVYYWRIIFGKGAKAVVTSVEINMQEIVKAPSHSPIWVAYGSSISHGSGSSFITQSFLHTAADSLGYDILNKSVSGISFIEPQIADYVASLSAKAFVSLELGLNMIGKYPIEIFKQRVKYLLHAVLSSAPSHIAVITPILCHYCLSQSSKKASWTEYSYCLEELCSREYPDIQLIDGTELVQSFDFLQSDMLHPSSKGHMLMSSNILKQLSRKTHKYIG